MQSHLVSFLVSSSYIWWKSSSSCLWMSFSVSLLTAEWLQTPTHAACFFMSAPNRFVLASRRRPCNAQTPQDCGIHAVAVALDDHYAQRRIRVHNVSSLILRKGEEDVLRLTDSPIKPAKNSCVGCELRNTRGHTDGT